MCVSECYLCHDFGQSGEGCISATACENPVLVLYAKRRRERLGYDRNCPRQGTFLPRHVKFPSTAHKKSQRCMDAESILDRVRTLRIEMRELQELNTQYRGQRHHTPAEIVSHELWCARML